MGELLVALTLAGGALAATPAAERWKKYWRNKRRQRLEAEIARVRADLQAAVALYASGLNGKAHEARKALILASMEFSRRQDSGETGTNRPLSTTPSHAAPVEPPSDSATVGPLEGPGSPNLGKKSQVR